ncbi:hypothetical protein PR048_000269, partial [Dryococelus australis]
MKDTAYAPLLEKVKTIDPEATRDTILKGRKKTQFTIQESATVQEVWNEHTRYIALRAKIMVFTRTYYFSWTNIKHCKDSQILTKKVTH